MIQIVDLICQEYVFLVRKKHHKSCLRAIMMLFVWTRKMFL